MPNEVKAQNTIDLTSVKDLNDAVENVDQYFWHTETGQDAGAHITEVPKDDFIANPQGGNVKIDSNSLVIRAGLTEVANFSGTQIELGKNSSSSKISFCNNIGEISYNNGSFRLEKKDKSSYKPFLALSSSDTPSGAVFIGSGAQSDDLDVLAMFSSSGITMSADLVDDEGGTDISIGFLTAGMTASRRPSPTARYVYAKVSVNASDGVSLWTSDDNGYSTELRLGLGDRIRAFIDPYLIPANKGFITLVLPDDIMGDTEFVSLGVGTGGINHGVYSDINQKWITYADDSGNVYFDGINLAKLFKVVSGTTSGTFTINSGAGFYKDVPLSAPSGYTLVAVAGFDSNHNQAVNIGNAKVQSNSSIRVSGRNNGASNLTDMKITAYGLYVLSGAVG